MSKYTWEKVEWDNSGDLIQLLMSGKEIYLYRNSSDFAWYNGGRTNESPFRFGNLDLNFGYTYSGIGYIRKEVDWTDVVSEDNSIILTNISCGSIYLATKVPTFPARYAPTSLEEIKPYIWECMQDE